MVLSFPGAHERGRIATGTSYLTAFWLQAIRSIAFVYGVGGLAEGEEMPVSRVFLAHLVTRIKIP
jgi:hypothetical protein